MEYKLFKKLNYKEQGTWQRYDSQKDPDPVVGGNYAAMWVREGKTWLIKSQLFVTLE